MIKKYLFFYKIGIDYPVILLYYYSMELIVKILHLVNTLLTCAFLKEREECKNDEG